MKLAQHAFVFALSLAPLPAAATAVRTFVKSTGVDTGACTLSAPCRSFAYAILQTSPSGELDVLDTAGYGTATLTHGMSIIAPAGLTASIAAPANQDAITVSVGASDKVVLRGLTVEGGGTGRNGIRFNSGAKLTIADCTIQDFVTNGGTGTDAGNGVYISPASGAPKIVVTNTKVSNNALAGLGAFLQNTSSATITLTVDQVLADGNLYGVALYSFGQPIQSSISNTIATGNLTSGYYFGNSTISLDNATANANGTGILVDSGSVAIGRSVIVGNGTGLSGFAQSFGDNRFKNNGSDGTGGLTQTSLH